MTVFQELAEFIVDTEVNQIPKAALASATESFVDTIAVIFAGRDEPITQIVRGVVSADTFGPCWLVSGGGACARVAAFVNAAAAHSMDYDDATTTALSGHASAILIPSVLASGQECGRSGIDALAAYACGYEVELALARILNPWHFDQGFHPTSTIGVFGAAAVACRMRELSTNITATALAIAASLASGVKANFGTMTKPFQVSWAAHSGFVAASLAETGLTANQAVFEDRLGFADAYAGPIWKDRVTQAIGLLGLEWALADPGVDLRKIWPVCGSVITTIEAAAQIRRTVKIEATEVESITVGIHSRRVAQVDRPRPKSGQDARYSAQYVAVRTLLNGSIRADDFRDDALNDSTLVNLLERTTVVPDPAQSARTATLDGRDLGAHLTVRMLDGTMREAVVDFPIGSPGSPLPKNALVEKFLNATGQVLTRTEADALYSSLISLDSVSDLRKLPALAAVKA